MAKQIVDATTLPQFGRFETLGVIGEGATASVYLARDPRLGRKVAIKAIKPHLLGNANLLARFEKEARIVAALRHENIVEVHDFEIQDDQQYLVMEFVEGPTLQSILNNLDGRPIPAQIAGYIASQAANGLKCAHARGLVHRDIKPDNLLLTANGKVKIADFGIAHIGDMGATNSGDILGTPYFMAPEQTVGDVPSPQTDMWALGVVLYYCLTGHHPFSGASFPEIKRAILEGKYEPMKTYVANLEEFLVSLVDTLLKQAPQDRRNPTWLSQQLEKYVSETGLKDWDAFLNEFIGHLKLRNIAQTVMEIGPSTRSKTTSPSATAAKRKKKKARLNQLLLVAGTALFVAMGVTIFFLSRPAQIVKVVPANVPESSSRAIPAEPVKTDEQSQPAKTMVVQDNAIPNKPINPITPTPPTTSAPAKLSSELVQTKPAKNPEKMTSARKNLSAGPIEENQKKSLVTAPENSAPKQPIVDADTLEIITIPPMADVVLNGKPSGQTPFVQKLDPGQYSVKVYHSSFPNKEKEITLKLNPGKNSIKFNFMN